MITAVKATNISAYKTLFEEASDILSGYKRVRTYDADVDAYYYKDAKAESEDELFIEESSIDSLLAFANALELHKVLYVKTGEAVEGFSPMLGITTLEEYFSWIKNLGQINRKYTVLPLDEDHFEINADTRAINIPASFKKNGIAVQGDDLAEIVYFEIDRYFDYMDLNNADIYIQWETPKDPATGTTTKSVSAAYIRDIESKPGKLIFGWAISDALTKYPGALKFSVRFFQWEDEDEVLSGGDKILAYSLSTLTASLNVMASIGFDPEVDEYSIDDCGNRLIERLENSEIAGGYAAAMPIFLLNLDVPNVNLVYDLDPETGEYLFKVQAYATDTGTITYTWKKQEIAPDGTEGMITTLNGKKVMTAVEDVTKTDPTKTYYQINGMAEDGDYTYIVYEGNIPPSAEDIDKGLVLYERQSGLTVDSVGKYWAVAENRITNSSSSLESFKAIIPHPEDVVIDTQPVAKGILVAKVIEEPGENGETTEITIYTTDLSVISGNDDGVLTYQWEYDDNFILNFGEEKPDFAPIEGAIESTYVADEPGHYRVIVTNTRNKSSKTLTSEISRVTHAATEPLFINEDTNTKVFQVNSLTADNCPTVWMDPDVLSDGYSVTWYLSQNDESIAIAEDINLGAGVYKASFNPFDYEEKILDISDDQDIDGTYYAIITNHVNGSVKSSEKPEYDDMFKVTY